MKTLILIKPDGTIVTMVQGAAGSECLAATEGMEQFFGQPEERRLTPDYHKQPDKKQQKAGQ
jgi:hypothetical protein